jgi:hypothetical protein
MPDDPNPQFSPGLGGLMIGAGSLQRPAEGPLADFLSASQSSPAQALEALRRLLKDYANDAAGLAALVQPEDLVVEVRLESSELSGLVLGQWVRLGETAKLKHLADALLAQPPGLIGREMARLMVVLAGVLGILRPSLAQRLYDQATPALDQRMDLSLQRDARQWVEAGSLLEDVSPQQRAFWNRRLRESGTQWDWEGAEARLALGDLGRRIAPEDLDLQLFQRVLPPCWWDLWRSRTEPVVASPRQPAVPAKTLVQVQGWSTRSLMLAVVATASLTWWLTALGPLGLPSPTEQEAAAAADGQDPAPPIRESLRQLQEALRGNAQANAAGPSTGIGERVARWLREPSAEGALPTAGKQALRERAAAEFFNEHPQVVKLHKLAKEGSYRENAALIEGSLASVQAGSPEHAQLLQALILDPPQQADSRQVVTKLALRELSADELAPLFELCCYPGSPNELEVQQCSQLLLDLPNDGLSSEIRSRLQRIVARQR